MTTSICIPFKNDYELIDSVIKHIIDTTESDDYEIIVYNDGSVWGTNKPRELILNYPKVRVINSNKSFGVGYAFDRCVEVAKGETIVLMGSDVYTKDGWYEKVQQAVAQMPNTLGCSVCVGNEEPFRRYYGADLLFTYGTDDLPPKSKLRERVGGYTDLFQGRWRGKTGDDPYDLPCLMGAFYFTSKTYYQKIGGWDTLEDCDYQGHRCWGSLEPYISLKSWLIGGGCTLYPEIEATHIFSRATERITERRRRPRIREKQVFRGGRGKEWRYWNKIFMLETMIFDEGLKQKMYNFMHYELNWGVAQKMIREHWDAVQRVKERNRLKFINTHNIFTEKFNYNFDIK